MIEFAETIDQGIPEKRYKIAFSGKIAKGRELEEVKRNLTSLFNIGDGEISQLFSGKPVVIKDSTNYESMMKYKMAFETAGAVCRVKEVPTGVGKKLSEGAKSKKPSKSKQPEMMTCPKCNFEQEVAVGCIKCGIIINKYSKEIKETGQEIPQIAQPNKQPRYFPVSKFKLVLMSICTFGLYELYWFYKNWQFIKKRSDQKLSPFWRSFFSIIFCYHLFKHIQVSADSNSCKSNINPGWLLVGYVALCATWRLPEPFDLISLLTFLPLLPVQEAINNINLKAAPGAKRNDNFSISNIVFIIIGCILWIFCLLGVFMPSLGSKVGDEFKKYDTQSNQGESISHSSASVVIYTTPGCGYCNLAKSFFRKRNIDYIEYDITSSQEGLREFKELNGRGVPLIFIGETRVDGYSEQLLRSALEQKGFL